MIDTNLPVELWPLCTDISASYSISSSALLSLKLLYGIEGYTVGRDLDISAAFPAVKLARAVAPAWTPQSGSIV